MKVTGQGPNLEKVLLFGEFLLKHIDQQNDKKRNKDVRKYLQIETIIPIKSTPEPTWQINCNHGVFNIQDIMGNAKLYGFVISIPETEKSIYVCEINIDCFKYREQYIPCLYVSDKGINLQKNLLSQLVLVADPKSSLLGISRFLHNFNTIEKLTLAIHT